MASVDELRIQILNNGVGREIAQSFLNSLFRSMRAWHLHSNAFVLHCPFIAKLIRFRGHSCLLVARCWIVGTFS